MTRIDIDVCIHPAGVSHMDGTAKITVERTDWSKPWGERRTVIGTFTPAQRDEAHDLARRAANDDAVELDMTRQNQHISLRRAMRHMTPAEVIHLRNRALSRRLRRIANAATAEMVTNRGWPEAAWR